MVFTPGRHDGEGFNDDETEAWREMHQLRNQLETKWGCLVYIVLLVGVAIFLIIELLTGTAG